MHVCFCVLRRSSDVAQKETATQKGRGDLQPVTTDQQMTPRRLEGSLGLFEGWAEGQQRSSLSGLRDVRTSGDRQMSVCPVSLKKGRKTQWDPQ